MKPKSAIRNILAALGAATIAVSSASAADVTWDTAPGTVGPGDSAITGGTETWDTTNGNWTIDAGANNIAWDNANNDTAIFGGTAGTVTLGANVTVGGITSNTNGYIIDPGTGPFGINFGAPGNINISTGTTTINAAISGSAITKTGGGALTLSVANTFNGLNLNGGTVSVNGTTDSLGADGSTITVLGSTTLTQAASGAISLNKNLAVDAGTLTFVHGNNRWEIQGVVSGSGTIKVNDAGSDDQRPLRLINAANTFTGAIDLTGNRATINVASLGDSVGAGNILFGGNTSMFYLGTEAVAPMTLTNRAFEFQGGSTTATIQNRNTASSSANTLTINSNLSVTTSGSKELRLGGANTGDNTFAGIIANGSGTVSLRKLDAGKWILSNDNTFTGYVYHESGTLVLSGTNQYTGTTTLQGGTLVVSSIKDFGEASSLGKPASGAIVAERYSSAQTLSYVGTGDTSNRTFAFRAYSLNDNAGVNLNNDGTGALVFTAATFNEYDANSANRKFMLNLGGTYTGGTNEIQGTIQNTRFDGVNPYELSLTKAGAGTWELSGDNTYTGTTAVNGGTLIINGNSSTATGNVTVSNTGTTLGGIGTVGGNTTFNTGTILSPGESPGTLSFAQNLTLNNASTYYFEGGDLTAVTGTLTLNNTWNLALGTGFLDGGSVTLFTYGIKGSTFNLTPSINIDDLGFTPVGSLSLFDTGSSVVLNGVSVIPEPSSAALLGSIGLLMLLRRRRK